MAAVGYVRRYGFNPGLAEITKIEGVVIITREPPGLVLGVGTGVGLLFAEFEDGPFETVTEIINSGDLTNLFGGFGFTYDSVNSNHPCARSRNADAQVTPEYWNGNGFIALGNKKFRRLLVSRVDTSVGSVQFTRCASASGSSNFTFDLEPAQVVGVKLNGAGAVSATFNAAAATKNSAVGTYPSTFVGGETITYKIDGTTYTTTFLATDQTQNQVIARLNATVGYAAFVNGGGGITSINGRQRGLGGSVQIISVSGVLVTTATGFSAGAAQAGTGNVQNIDQVTLAEAKSIIELAVAGTTVDRDANGAIRISNTGTPATGTIEIDSATTTATGFGFTLATVYTAVTGLDGTIPAGTRVQTAGAVVFVTMQTITVTAASAGPYSVKVRHALDDGTGASQLVSTLTVLTSPIALGAFSVTNTLPISAALSEGAIDAKYITAIDKSKATSTVAKVANLTFSARQSNAIRSRLRQNANDASANGCQGRVTLISPPLGTTRAVALSLSSQPGMGAYRGNRVIYAYPGVASYFPQIAERGLAGGAGFSVDGIIDTHFDSWAGSLCSQLNPEENPGQETTFMEGASSIERNNPDVQNLDMNDYIAFRAAGIVAPRFDEGVGFIQSGVVDVDPVANAAIKNISRQRMEDFLTDSLNAVIQPRIKKLSTLERRATTVSLIRSFMGDLKGNKNDGSDQRISDFSLDPKSGNTTTSIAAGIFWLVLKCQTLPSMDVVVLDVQVGETVVIQAAA